MSNIRKIPEKTTGDFPCFIEFVVSKKQKPTDEKKLQKKKDELVDWKLSDVKTALPYSTNNPERCDYAPCLQPEFLKKEENEAERLSSVNIFLRTDHLGPKTIIMENKGFQPKGTNNDYGPLWKKNPNLILNIGFHRERSTFSGSVSFTDTIRHLKKNPMFLGNYIYMAKAVGAVNKGTKGQAHLDSEYTVPGGVDSDDIIAFIQLSSTDLSLGFAGSSLYIRESFLEKYGADYLLRILSVYLNDDEIVTPNVKSEKFKEIFDSAASAGVLFQKEKGNVDQEQNQPVQNTPTTIKPFIL